LLRVFLRQFGDPLIYILLVAAAVSFAIGSIQNGAFIGAVLLLNAIIGTVQEWKAEASAAALRSAVEIPARVRRDGEVREVEAEALVPGDVVRVESGDRVPADLRLTDENNVRADESLLTGESTPVDKDAEAAVEEDAPVGDRATLLHAGSALLSGRAEGVVVRTGTGTEIGRIAASLSEGEGQVPPLVVKMRRFTRIVGLVVLGAIVLLAAVQMARGSGWQEVFFLAVALAVSAIPAGLPVALTVALSIGAKRMAERNVIVRQLPAVEGLGSCTLVASDKTGTLTENALTVARVWLAEPDVELEVSGRGHAPEGEVETPDGEAPPETAREALARLAESGALANEGRYEVPDQGEPEVEGDPNDVAFLVLAHKVDARPDDDAERAGFIPFESDHRYAAAFVREGDEVVAHVKGAPSVVAEMCEGVEPDDLEERVELLAGQGYRVLAVARGPVSASGEPGAQDLSGLRLQGLAGSIDPTRAEVPEAIERCRTAGVEVRMVTGDHPSTGYAIGESLGIVERRDEVLVGSDLDEDESALDEQIRDKRVFARVEPHDKTRIVESLQRGGHFVAVTGDGVNDAPALRAAHIGVAMGEGGTDVARQTSDLILTDDNFASIVAGIEQGRVAYANVRKVIWLLASTGTAEVLLFFLSIFAGLPIPLGPIQLLWLNLVTNGIQDVALAFEAGESDVLKQAPRAPDEPIFDAKMVEQVLLSGAYIGGVAFAVYYTLMSTMSMSEAGARNLTLLLMVLFENMHAFSCRSETRSLFRVPLKNNPWLVVAVLAAQGIHIASMYIPGWNDVLGVAPVTWDTWLVLFGVAASLLVFDELAKLVRRWLKGRRSEKREPAPA
ncbi:MAG TPA: HAD-IC family P-type ATPase, partial [Sandaracinaceae bacterium LLY-WYZ-13_1]|nr:HAD-IC family P-type ATPase [Sandaracinaceae bacterium LLY-WYZ-13_1]